MLRRSHERGGFRHAMTRCDISEKELGNSRQQVYRVIQAFDVMQHLLMTKCADKTAELTAHVCLMTETHRMKFIIDLWGFEPTPQGSEKYITVGVKNRNCGVQPPPPNQL